MPRKVVPLTDKAIKNAKSREKEYKLFDGGGLYLSIEPNGSKGWRLKYLIDGKEKRISLGVYDTVTLSEARIERDRLKKLIRENIDPSTLRKNEKAEVIKQAAITQAEIENTFEKIALEYLERVRSAHAENTHELKKARLKNHVFPFIGSNDIATITRMQLLEVIHRIEERGNLETARKILNVCGQIWQYAVTVGKIPHNIIADIDKRFALKPKIERHFPTITEPKAIGILLKSVDDYHGEFTVKCALKLAIYTASRPYNIRFAEWDEFDLVKNEWNIPGEKMKMNRPHIVPITTQIKSVLDDIAPHTKHKSRYLFPSLHTNVKPISENTLNQALRRIGYSKEEIVSHGLRAMFSTIAHENISIHGYHSDVIERCLAHTEKNKVKNAYNHAEYKEERIGLMTWYNDYLTNLALEVNNESNNDRSYT
jgi:integrase